MLKKRLKISMSVILILALGLIGNFNMELSAQLIPSKDDYPSYQTHIAIVEFDKKLIKNAETRLLDIILNYSNSNVVNDIVTFHLAKIDLQCGNYKLAQASLDVFVQERNNSPFVAPAYLLSGYIELEQGNYLAAEKYFEKASNSANADKHRRDDFDFYNDIEHSALYWQSISMSHQGKYLDAVSYFERCYKDFSGGIYQAQSLYALGTIAEINNDYEKSIEYFTKIQDEFPYSSVVVVAMIRTANDALLLRNPQKALLHIYRAEQSVAHIQAQDSIGNKYMPQDYFENAAESIEYLKGEIYNQTANFDKTIAVLNNFATKYPNSKLKDYVYMALGLAYLNKAEFNTAKEYYTLVVNNEKADVKTRGLASLFAATCYKKLGNVGEAQNILSGLAVEPNYPYLSQVLLELGQIYYEKGDYDLARRTLERAEREADNAKTQIRITTLLGASYLELRQYSNAINVYKNVINIAEHSSDILIPNRQWYMNEARLKQGIALVLYQRSAEAIPLLLAYIAQNENNPQIDEAQFWLAEAYYHSDMFENAAETYDRIINNYVNSKRREEAYYGRGWSFFRQKKFKNSSAVFDKMLKEFPNSKFALEVLTRQGDGFYIVKQYGNAVECYRKAAQIGPKTEDGQYASYQLAHALYRQSKYEQSITALLNFVKNYPKSPFAPNSLYLIGWIRFQQGKYSEAVDNFHFLISTYPQSRLIPRAYFAIADCYYNQGNYEEAITGYKYVVEQFPSSDLAPEAMRSVQYALLALGREDEAIGIADQYIGDNPESPFIEEFSYKKAEMFYSGRKFNDAIAEFENFSKSFPNSEKNAEALYWMGKSYVSINDFDNAAKYFTNLSLKYAKSDYAALALLEYAILLKDNNLVDTSDAILRKIIERYPSHEVAPQAGFMRGVLAWGKGDTLRGIDIFREVADNYKETDFGDQSRYRIAMYHRMKGNVSEAIAEFEKIAEVYDNPSISAEARYRIGELYLRADSLSKAEENFVIIRDKFAGYEDWYSLGMLHLGEIYEKNDKKDEAREIYATILELRPEDEFGKTARTRLKRIK
jgi:tol-pal system protein YbgF